MAEKQINPIMKQVLELGPTLVFFVIYLRIKEKTYMVAGTEYSGFIMATLIFVPILLVSMAILWKLTGKLSRMQVFVAFMVIFFGGLTAWFNDERFFKMKTSIVYGFFATILTIGLLRGRSYLRYILEDFMPMQQEGWMILTRRVMWLFFGLAALNEVIWRTMSTETWVYFKTFGLTAAILVFFMFQGGLFKKYSTEEAAE